MNHTSQPDKSFNVIIIEMFQQANSNSLKTNEKSRNIQQGKVTEKGLIEKK